jgi:hypothetical protein
VGGAGRIEHAAHRELEKPGAPFPSIQHRELSRSGVREELKLPARYPHLPQPHWMQVMQPEVRAMGPAHSGQTRMLLSVSWLFLG